jgi:cytochrome o ubiquinol oxidase subunit IV
MSSFSQKRVLPLTLGLFLSLLLTFMAYFLAISGSFSPKFLNSLILILAIFQAGTQLLIFSPVHREQKPHWYRITLLFMGVILLVIAIGSLWIMYHLNYNLAM